MANTIRFKRGSTIGNAGTPASGEPLFDTSNGKLYVGDGSTSASSLTAISDDKLALTGGTITSNLLTLTHGSLDTRFKIEASASNRAGILQLLGGSSDKVAIDFGQSGGTGDLGRIRYDISSTTMNFINGDHNSPELILSTSSATFAENVGIGMSPDMPLNVKVATNEVLRVRSDSGVQLTARNEANSADVAMLFRGSSFSFQQGNATFAGTITQDINTTSNQLVLKNSNNATAIWIDNNNNSVDSALINIHGHNSSDMSNFMFLHGYDSGGSGSTKFKILGDGSAIFERVGIGTDDPKSMLHLSTDNGPELTLSDANAGTNVKNYGIYSDSGLLGFRRKDDSHSGYSPTMVIKESNVGIGTTSINSNAKLHIRGGDSGQTSSSNNTQLTVESSGTAGIQLLTGTNGIGGFWIGDSNGSETGGKLYYNNNDNSWSFYNAGSTNTILVESTGRMTTSGDILPGADVILSNGRGISFTNMPNESGMTSELLDDYEEGIYSVAITGATSGSWTLHADHTNLAYTKIGRMVTIIGKYETTSGSGSGSLRFSLPFTPATLGNTGGVAAGSITINRYGSANNIVNAATAIAFENIPYIYVQVHSENGGTDESYVQADNIDGNFEGQIGITYFTAT